MSELRREDLDAIAQRNLRRWEAAEELSWGGPGTKHDTQHQADGNFPDAWTDVTEVVLGIIAALPPQDSDAHE